MDVQYTVDGVATVPDGTNIDDIVISTTVFYPGVDNELIAVGAWDNQVTAVDKGEYKE